MRNLLEWASTARILRSRYVVSAIALLGLCSALVAQEPQRPPLPTAGPMARMAAQPLFNNNCASCHRNVMSSVEQKGRDDLGPNTETLSQMTPEAIYAAMTTGSMVQQSAKLSDAEKKLIAEFFGGRPMGNLEAGEAKNMPNRCPANAPASSSTSSWHGFGNDLEQTRFQPAKAAGLSAENISKLKLRWAFGLPNGSETSSQPTVADGRVYLGGDNSYIYSLNAAIGCVYWSFRADAKVRTSIVIGPVKVAGKVRQAALFGDHKANIYALDAHDGTLLWKVNIEKRQLAHITGSPVLYEGRVYAGVAGSEEVTAGDPHYPCCTYRGSLSSLDANSGKVIWKSYTIPEAPRPIKKNSLGTQLWAPAGASIWTTPTIDTKLHLVYVTTGNAFSDPAAKESDAIMAFDLKSGKRVWQYQAIADDASPGGCGGRGPKAEHCPEKVGPDYDYGASAMLRTLANGKRLLVAADKGGTVTALDPDRKGAVLWKADLSDGAVAGPGGQILWGGAADDKYAYHSLWTGAVAAVSLSDGKIAWLTRVQPSGAGPRARKGLTAAVTVIPGVVFAGSWDGVIHALSSGDGRILWEFNTAQEFKTVNGVAAKGGSLGAPGPIVVDGTLFIGSGYIGVNNGMPGNVLLAFSTE
jgi:polyvinyl alcohol dehydrogenase (cytochrome)